MTQLPDPTPNHPARELDSPPVARAARVAGFWRLLGTFIPFLISILPWFGITSLERFNSLRFSDKALHSANTPLELRATPTPQPSLDSAVLPPRKITLVVRFSAPILAKVKESPARGLPCPLFENRRLEGG
jgi:hypothetical protein